jgi:tetratricopeptide (TPR) repeat protein
VPIPQALSAVTANGILLLCAVLLTVVIAWGQAPLRTQAPATADSRGAAQDEPAALEQIRDTLRQGRFAEARDQARVLVERFPTHALGWTYLAMASVRLGETDAAIKAYEQALAFDSNDPRPFFDVALLYASTRQFDRGIERFQQGLKIAPENGPAWYNLGRLLLVTRQLGEARKALEKARELTPNDSGVRLALAEVLLRLNELEPGVNEAKAVLEAADATPEVLVSVAILLRHARQYDLAGNALDRIGSSRSDWAPLLLERSRLALATGRQQEAIATARRAVELAPDELEAHLALAEALISSAQDASAVQHLTGVQARFHAIAAFQYTLGIAQFRAHDFHAAVASLQKAIEINPALDNAHFLLGSIALGSGDLAEAEQRLQAAVRLQPDHALYYTYLARVYEKKGPEFRVQAGEATRQVLRLDPGDIESRERLARWAKDEGNLGKARELLEGIVGDNESYLPAHRLLAIVYHQMGLEDAARAEQQRLKDLEQSSAAVAAGEKVP